MNICYYKKILFPMPFLEVYPRDRRFSKFGLCEKNGNGSGFGTNEPDFEEHRRRMHRQA